MSDLVSSSPWRFRTTRWSLVLAVAEDAAGERARALDELCRIYWKPLYAWLRRRQPQLTPEEAEDGVQGFFERLLERDAFEKVDRVKGRFRSFLCASLEHHLANEHTRARAQKRGGRFEFVSWDAAGLEETVQEASRNGLTPDQLLERTWACALLEQVLGRLRSEFAAAGKNSQFEALQVYLGGDRGAVSYEETAARLGLGESAVKMAIRRLRLRFRDLLREEVAHTVTRPEEVDDEIRALFTAVNP